MDPPNYGYEYWKDYHSDCELVHVMWTDYCGILNEKLVPAEHFNKMYRKHAYKLSDCDDLTPLTVNGTALTNLPDGHPPGDPNRFPHKKLWFNSSRVCDLVPDYDSLQSCIDSRSRATVFAKVVKKPDDQVDPREILKEVCGELRATEEQNIRASLEFQFVLRGMSDDKLHLPKSDGPAQVIAQKLAQALKSHGHGSKGLSIQSIDISRGGVVTIALSMSDNLLEAVDNFYRVKRAIHSIASLENLRPSFFHAWKRVSGIEFSGTSYNVMCENKLHCRLHLALTNGTQACHFAAGIMDTEEGLKYPSIHAFSKPNWLTYAQRGGYQGDQSPKSKWMTWGVGNSETTINFPKGCDSGRLEFGDIDCMANLYLVVAAIAILGRQRTGLPGILLNKAQGRLSPSNALVETMRRSLG